MKGEAHAQATIPRFALTDIPRNNSAQSRPWTLFRGKKKTGRKGFRQDDRKSLTEPKPDWVAFFPIYDHKRPRIPTPKRWQLTKGLRKGITENFLYTTLQHLARFGVESNTAGLFRRRPRQTVVRSDFICFPWLIVEHKKAGKTAKGEECYCQAANAGTAAIMMLETLSAIVPGSKQQRTNEHIPPVVAVTTVDKDVRVWITYSCKPSYKSAAKYVRAPAPSPPPHNYLFLMGLGLTDLSREWTAFGKGT